jgi:hypothetical protein
MDRHRVTPLFSLRAMRQSAFAGAVLAASPVRQEWWKIGEPRVLGLRRLAVVAVPATTVLVRNIAPAPVCQWCIRLNPENLNGIDRLLADCTQMSPVIAQIEYVHELLARLQARQLNFPVVATGLTGDFEIRIRVAQPGLTGQGELLQVRPVPAGESVVDGVGELFERMAFPGREDPPRPRPVQVTTTFDQLHPNREPGSSQMHTPLPVSSANGQAAG